MSHMFDFITGKRIGKEAELAASLEHALGLLGAELEANEQLRKENEELRFTIETLRSDLEGAKLAL